MLAASAVVQVSPTTNVGLPLGALKGWAGDIPGCELNLSPRRKRWGQLCLVTVAVYHPPQPLMEKKKMEKIHIKHGASSPASLTNASSLKRFIHSSHSRMRGNGTAHPRQSDAGLVPKNAQQPVTCKLGWGWSLRDLYGGGRGCQSSLEELCGP